jgi:SecD/SecF fusion protein
VFERIREEFSVSGRIATSIQAGYQKAFSAILDSNVTTVIAGMILLHFDSGPIKGFALTLIIGVVSSMFTALFMTKFFFARWVQNPHNKKLNMLSWFRNPNFDFLKYRNKAIVLSVIIIGVGALFFASSRNTIMGMDFTGGYSLNLEIEPSATTKYRTAVEKALIVQGLTPQDIQIRELSPANHIKIFLSRGLEQKGKPFYHMPVSEEGLSSNYPGNNPRINWIVSVMKQNDLPLTLSSLSALDSNWSEISGQMSDTMRNNAIIGLLIALVSILIYITIRFEFKYAMSAILCLAHDIGLTIGSLAILHACKVPVQIDLNIIAALMTIVGYSLNDTIIIFDRIREDLQSMKKGSLKEIINQSLNVTLSRTMMTSGTTLLVLLPLILLGGSTILGFSLVMAIGVVFGTLSSLFIAAPLLLFFEKKPLPKSQNRIIDIS